MIMIVIRLWLCLWLWLWFWCFRLQKVQPGFGDRFPPCRARLGCRWISMDFRGESMRRRMVMIMFNMTCWVVLEIFSSGWILSPFEVIRQWWLLMTIILTWPGLWLFYSNLTIVGDAKKKRDWVEIFPMLVAQNLSIENPSDKGSFF